jgi:hypothetical protein
MSLMFSSITSVVERHDRQALLNFNHMINSYVQRFAKTNPKDALQYYLLLYLYGDLTSEFGRDQIECAHDYVRQLVYDTQAYAQLVENGALGQVCVLKCYTLSLAIQGSYYA